MQIIKRTKKSICNEERASFKLVESSSYKFKCFVMEFKGQNVKKILSLEWNVSYSDFTEFPLVICSAP